MIYNNKKLIKKKTEVNAFLTEFKNKASKTGIVLIRRDKNELAKLGLTKLEFDKEVLSLTYKNYCRGPEPDKDFPGEIWIFGKNIDYDEYYVKLKISKKKCAVCISFHPAEHSIHYPLN